MSVKNFVSFQDAQELFAAVGKELKAKKSGYTFRGNSTFANLPATLTEAMDGYVYNVTDAFTTDSRFQDGIGKKYPAGTDVVVADLSTYAEVTPQAGDNPATEGWYELYDGKYIITEDTSVESGKTYYAKTAVYKFAIGQGFIDVDGINDRINTIAANLADEFDSTNAYAIGAIVTHDDGLFKFKAAHTADTDWDVTEVDAITVEELIAASEPDSLTTAQVNALLALLN